MRVSRQARRLAAACLLGLALAILALWVRGQWVTDILVVVPGSRIQHSLVSGDGGLWWHLARRDEECPEPPPRFASHPHGTVFSGPSRIFPGFRVFRHRDFAHVSAPCWFLFALAIAGFGGFVSGTRKS